MKLYLKQIVQHWALFRTSVLIIGLVWIWVSRLPLSEVKATAQAPAKGFEAPDFVLSDASGQEIRLSDFKGRPVLLNFWASWCPPCQDEMPAMQRVSDRYEDDFIILAVNTTYQDDELNARMFVQDLGLTFPILFDRDGSVSKTYRISAMPTSYFIDSFGIIKEVVIGGPMAEALLVSRIQQLTESTLVPVP